MMNDAQRLRYAALQQKGQEEALKDAEVQRLEQQQREREKAEFETFINEVLTPALAEVERELATHGIRVSPSDPKSSHNWTYWRIFHVHSNTARALRSVRIRFDGTTLLLTTPSTVSEEVGHTQFTGKAELPVGAATIPAITGALYDLILPPGAPGVQ